MMTNVLLEPGSLKAGEGELRLGLRLPWYRGLPLSVIQVDELRIDGRDVPLEEISFVVNGTRRTLPEMADLTGEYWFVADTMELAAPVDGAVVGRDHEVDVTVSFFPPYIADFRRKTRGHAKMKAA